MSLLSSRPHLASPLPCRGTQLCEHQRQSEGVEFTGHRENRRERKEMNLKKRVDAGHGGGGGGGESRQENDGFSF